MHHSNEKRSVDSLLLRISASDKLLCFFFFLYIEKSAVGNGLCLNFLRHCLQLFLARTVDFFDMNSMKAKFFALVFLWMRYNSILICLFKD